jgi:hypothetical protein
MASYQEGILGHVDAKITDPELVEAISLLRDRHMEQCRARGRRDEAAQSLFKQLVELDGRYELQVKERYRGDWNDLLVVLPPAQLQVTYLRESGVCVARYGEQGRGVEVVLDYDQHQQQFVGRERDQFRTPVPGQPVSRRPAIAVLVETIIAAAKGQ